MARDLFPDSLLRLLLVSASFMIVVKGLKEAEQIILPVLFSVFLAILAQQGVRVLRRLGLPKIVAIPAVVLGITGALLGVTAIIGGALAGFTADLPKYQEPLNQLFADGDAWLRSAGERLGLDAADLSPAGGEGIDAGSALALVGSTLNAVIGVLSNLLIVVLLVTFMLFEAASIEHKIEAAFGNDPRTGRWLAQASEKVQRYLAIKTLISLVTGTLVGAWTAVLGLDYPVLWGMLGFLLNYVPSIGSIIAAIPPMLLAAVTLGPGWALAVLAGYLVVNVSLGNLLEPRLMGQSLGLSTLVVFLSLLFWGWIWGPAGMLLSVPMTVIVKLVLEIDERTRWIAVLLGPGGSLPPKIAPEAAA